MNTTPAQVTEEHRELAPLIAYACYGGKFDDDQTDEQQIPERCLVVAAQLIADSEAKACDQLRAEVEHYKFLHQCESDSSVAAFARAERAEAELAGARASKLRWENEARNRLAELATERARLDWLESDAGVDWQWSDAARTVSRASIDAFMKEETK